MRVAHFTAGDIGKMTIQDSQNVRVFSIEDQKAIESQEHAYTAFDGDEVIACFGIAMYWTGRGYGWTFISKDIGGRLLYVTRVIKDIFKKCGIRRIEASVDCDFPQGHRWMRLLGMELEAPRMKSFFQDGKDCSLYARVA